MQEKIWLYYYLTSGAETSSLGWMVVGPRLDED
jgi:hypothetical protein